MESLYLLQDKVVSKSKSGDISGMLAVLMPDAEDGDLTWEGGKITKRLWSMIKAFMIWTYEEHKCESQVRLFYHQGRKVWAAVPLPQYISTGLSTEELKVHALRDSLLAKFPSDTWKEFGTVHHHCAAGAFQSGTDWTDETKCPGVHITLGHMSAKTLMVHSRCSFRGIIYDIDLGEWLEEPDLSAVATVEGSFPSEWKNSLLEKPRAIVYSAGSTGWFKNWRKGRDDASVVGAGVDDGLYPTTGYGMANVYGYDTSDYAERLAKWRRRHTTDIDTDDRVGFARGTSVDDGLEEDITYDYVRRELGDYIHTLRPESDDLLMAAIMDTSTDTDDAEAIIEALAGCFDSVSTLLTMHIMDIGVLCRILRMFIVESSYIDAESVDSTMMATILQDAASNGSTTLDASAKKAKKSGKRASITKGRKAKRKATAKTTKEEIVVPF